MSVISFLLAHKVVVLLITATAAFTISTIVLGVNNADLRKQIDDLQTFPTNRPITTPQTTNPPITPPVTDPPVTNPPITTTDAPITTALPPDMSKYRLPTSARPTSYDLYLYPDLESGLFRGTISVDTSILEQTTSVTMHSHQLDVNKVTINGQDAIFGIDRDFELLTIGLPAGTTVGSTVNITLDFEGDMKNRIVGLYSSSYVNEANETR